MIITFHIEGLGELRGLSFQGVEGISRLRQFEVEIIVPELFGVIPTSLAGTPARLTFGDAENPRTVSGIVTEVERGYQTKGGLLFKIVLAPRVARLRIRRDIRIYQNMSVPEIVAAVLQTAGILSDQFKFVLKEQYPKRLYCTQFRESDWKFIERLLEDEGIHSYFEEGDDGEILVMADAPSAHAPIEGGDELPFRPPLGAMAHGEHISRFGWTERMVPDALMLRDYNPEKPLLSLDVKAGVEKDAFLPVYDYPGDHESPERGKERAQVKAIVIASVLARPLSWRSMETSCSTSVISSQR